MTRLRSSWAGFVLVWLAGALLWSLAAARGADLSPIQTLPYGIVQMIVAGALALGVWRLTGVVAWRPRTWTFVAAHMLTAMAFAACYTAAQILTMLSDRSIAGAFLAVFGSPVTGWNLLMGAWLYLAIAGVSYTRRAEESRRAGERARSEAGILARDAQLAALNAQLRPHFLFNALHTVSALVHVDPDRADRALDELGKLLRYALRQPGEDVTLRQEWDFTRDYLAFEALRLGDRLRLDLAVDDSTLDVAVPPFILQPLVENAVHHGAAASPSGGGLAIRISRDGGAITLTVRNRSTAGAGAAGMAGTGLQRLRERLALKYGTDRATVFATGGAEFAVTVTLPCEPGEATG
jgi:hypothetical protein